MRKKFSDKIYPRELAAFKRMQARVARGYTTCFWPRTADGFDEFLLDLGTIPNGMRQPSIGRKNHSLGYAPDNCGWQTKRDNDLEALRRGRPKGKSLSVSHRRSLRKAWVKRRIKYAS